MSGNLEWCLMCIRILNQDRIFKTVRVHIISPSKLMNIREGFRVRASKLQLKRRGERGALSVGMNNLSLLPPLKGRGWTRRWHDCAEGHFSASVPSPCPKLCNEMGLPSIVETPFWTSWMSPSARKSSLYTAISLLQQFNCIMVAR